jgi:hypothetical protein
LAFGDDPQRHITGRMLPREGKLLDIVVFREDSVTSNKARSSRRITRFGSLVNPSIYEVV